MSYVPPEVFSRTIQDIVAHGFSHEQAQTFVETVLKASSVDTEPFDLRAVRDRLVQSGFSPIYADGLAKMAEQINVRQANLGSV